MFSEDRILDPDGDLIVTLTVQGIRAIRVRCSSKHLTLASPFFKDILSLDYEGANDLRSTGVLLLPLLEDDPDVLFPLLKIIHAQHGDVPARVDLPMLTRIAILVKKYQLHIAVELFARNWIAALGLRNSQCSMDDTRQWIFISWVFKWQDEYQTATKTAARATASTIGQFGEANLLIPPAIVVAIDTYRITAMSRITFGLYGIFNRYLRQNPTVPTCTLRCDSVVLGSLAKAMESIQILWTEPDYINRSYDSFVNTVRGFDIMTDCHCANSPSHDCLNKAGPEIQNLIDTIEGMFHSQALETGIMEDD